MALIRRKADNFLSYIPIINSSNSYEEGESGFITIQMIHNGIFDKVAQFLFFTPKVSRIRLDEYGSFLWKQMDGVNTVGELAVLLQERYGEAAQPLYERLISYLKILKNNRFIFFKRDDKIDDRV
ncbi:MAG: PqqD family protein [Lachnospiraceae bacterium]|nr:PqqD family protein [Lachnospiraceae bacterium]